MSLLDDRCLFLLGDTREQMRRLPAGEIACCVTSPPYWGLRDYGHDGQIGVEDTPEAYVARMVEVFREVRRVLRDDGTCWVNLGDSYVSSPRGNKNGWEGSGLNGAGSATYQATLNAGTARTMDKTKVPGLKTKDLVGIPWRVAFALQADGWYLRQDIIWHKPNPMPESVRDRCTKAHEYLFLLAKSERYHFDADAIEEQAASKGGGGMRNKRDVWTVPTRPFKGAHFATFPPALIEPCILAGSRPGDVVLDPFGGAGTTALVALQHGRDSVYIELNPEYAVLARDRLTTALGAA